jgi:putative effector of murein hydrolase
MQVQERLSCRVSTCERLRTLLSILGMVPALLVGMLVLLLHCAVCCLPAGAVNSLLVRSIHKPIAMPSK